MDGKLRNMTSIYLYDEKGRILMLYRMGSKVIKDSYIGTAGGHFENPELNDAKACALRELKEETGLTINDITEPQLKYVTLRYKDEEIRQNYYFFARLTNKDKILSSNEGRLKWFEPYEVMSLQMPHTAKYMIQHYINKGKDTNKLYGGIAVPDGVIFQELKQFKDIDKNKWKE